MAEWQMWLQWAVVLGCILPIIVMLVLGGLAYYFGRRWVSDFISPDLPKLEARLMAMKHKNPHHSDDKLLNKIINQQAFKCGIVGAVTGLGGFITLPITLPIDMLLTARYQATMISLMGRMYGVSDSLENKAATYAVMTGSTELSKLTSSIVRKYAPRFVGKSFSKLIPVVGAVFAFGLNYILARSMARAARVWYDTQGHEALVANLRANALASEN